MRKLFFVFLTILTVLFATTCRSDRKSETTSSPALTTGSLTFSVDWQGAPNLLAPAPGVFRAPIDCAAAGVASVEATLRNASCLGAPCATGPWDCTASAATTFTISNLRPGSGIRAGIMGKDANGNVLYFGEAVSAVTITAGQMTDAGVITASQIRTLATTTANPLAVAVDDTSVYWIETGVTTTSGAVKKAPLSGDGTVVTLASGLGRLRGIAVDSTSVYFGESFDAGGGSLKKVPKSGGTVTLLAGWLTHDNIRSIAIDSTSVYYFVFSGALGNGIFKIGLNGGAVSTIARGAADANIAVDETNVYFAGGTATSGSIMVAPITGANPTNPAVLVPDVGSVRAIAIDATNVYWTDVHITAGDCFVRKMAKAGGAVTILNPSSCPDFSMVVNGANVYWPARMGSFVVLDRAGINGGEARRIATDIQNGNNDLGIAIDSTSIYWPEFATGKIKSAAK